MSLINDALKRAGQVRRTDDIRGRSIRPGHGLEPAGLQARPTAWITLFLSGAILVCLLTAGILIVASMNRTTQPAGAAAANPAIPGPPVAGPSTSSAADPVAPPAAPGAKESPTDIDPVREPLLASDVPGGSAGPTAATEPDAGAGAGADVHDKGESAGDHEAFEAAVAALKLQAIIYHPENPLVMINGHTLGVGEPFDDHVSVIAIDRTGATLRIHGKEKRFKLY